MGPSLDEESERLAAVPRRGSTARQYDLLMAFMEEHGDLSRPARKGQSLESRIQQMQLWQQLERRLNAAEPARFSKTLLKWKKVWADLKNNVKRKAAVLRASGGRCGTRLSPYELRVLRVMGLVDTLSVRALIRQNSVTTTRANSHRARGPRAASPAAAGGDSRRARGPRAASPAAAGGDSLDEGSEEFDTTLDWSQNQNVNDESLKVEYLETGYEELEVLEELEELEHDEEPGAAAAAALEYEGEAGGALPRPDAAGHTVTRGVRVPRPQRALERAVRGSVRADRRWRRFLLAAQRREEALASARLRLRARELRLQERWQRVCAQGLALLERYLAPPANTANTANTQAAAERDAGAAGEAQVTSEPGTGEDVACAGAAGAIGAAETATVATDCP